MMIGGLVGFITSLHVIYDVALHSKESVMKILLWKSVADLGIAVRFLLNPLFDKYVCGSYQCTLLNGNNLLFFSSEILMVTNLCVLPIIQ